MASMPGSSTSSAKVWIPIDVKTRWFGFLGVPDLANCARVCKAWSSLVSKTADAEIAAITCAAPPTISRAGKLKFLHRLHYAYQPENMGYLLAWAAGSREYTPFLHKLLLLRDCIREDLGLPGGLHESARPDAFDELDDSIKALWTYKYTLQQSHTHHGSFAAPVTVDVVSLSPLLVAASRGNVDALNLLLLFGEGVHPRRKGNDKALYAAVEQGNIACVAALLGRVPIQPPRHPPHIAKRLGLLRPTWNVYGPGMVYSSGVAIGPLDVPQSIATAKIRAELAAATGLATLQGPKASAAAAAARSKHAASDAISSVEAMVAQQQLFENDGRYRSWSFGYHTGTYWYLYDTALSNYELIHGRIGLAPDEKGDGPEMIGQVQRPTAVATLTSPAQRSLHAAQRISVTLFNLESRLNARVAPGTLGPLVPLKARKESITAAYAAQALLVSKLPSNVPLTAASNPRKKGVIHPVIPNVVHHGKVAAEAIAIKARINIGPVEGRTPLFAACERGRTEIVFLLLSHHNPSKALSGELPEVPRRLAEADEPGAQPAAGAPAGQPANAPAAANPPAAPQQQQQQPAAPVAATPTAASLARSALAAIASAKSSALAVAFESVGGSESRRAEVYAELMQEERDRADVDAAPVGHHTPLCLACDRGDDRLVALLLHWGADVNKEGRKEARPLLVATMAGHEHLVKLMLRSSCAYETAKAVSEAIANLAALRGEKESALVQLFPSNGSNVERERGRSRMRGRSRGPGPAPSPMDGDGDDMFPVDDDAADAEVGAVKGALEMLGLENAVKAGTRSQSTSRSGGAQAAAALGSMIASQTRRTGGRRQLRRPEDLVVDVCEPTVVTTLLLAAAESTGDDHAPSTAVVVPGSVSTALPSGFTFNMYLPSDEANMSTGPAFRFGIFNPNLRRQASGGAGMGRLLHARNPSAGMPVNDLSDANVEAMMQNGTGATYSMLLEVVDALKYISRQEANKILESSRAIHGMGIPPGRTPLNVDLGDESGYTALFIAAAAGKLDSVIFLLAAGADCTVQTKRGETPIYAAVEKCNVEIVEHLLPKYSAHQLRANTTYGTNVMHAANKAGNGRIKDLLNQYCIDWDMREAKRTREAQAAKRWTGDPTKILTAEEKARKQDAYMKRMLGLSTDDDNDVADPLESVHVSAQIDKLRRMAEAARQKEEELEARRKDRERRAEEENTGGGGGPRKARIGATVQTATASFDGPGAASLPSPAAGVAATSSRGRSEVRSSAPPRAASKSTATKERAKSSTRAQTAQQQLPKRPSAQALTRTLHATRSMRITASDDSDNDLPLHDDDTKHADSDDDTAHTARKAKAAAAQPSKQSIASGVRSITTVKHALPVPPRIIPSPLTVPDNEDSKVDSDSKHDVPTVTKSPLGVKADSKVASPPRLATRELKSATASSGAGSSFLGKPPKSTSSHAAAAEFTSLPKATTTARRSSGASVDSGKWSDSKHGTSDDDGDYRHAGAGALREASSLDTSFSSDRPKSTKYAGSSVAEIRADAREQVREDAAASQASVGNPEDVRAKRAAFYEKLRKGDTTATITTAPTTVATAADTHSPLQVNAPSFSGNTADDEFSASVAQLRRLVRDRNTAGDAAPPPKAAFSSAARPGVAAATSQQAGSPSIRGPADKLVASSITDVLQRTAPGLASILNKLEAWQDGSTDVSAAPTTTNRSPLQAPPSYLGKPPASAIAVPDLSDGYGNDNASKPPLSPVSEPARFKMDTFRPPLKPREVFVDHSGAPSAHAVPGSTYTARKQEEKKKPSSAKATVPASSSSDGLAPQGIQLGIGGFAIGPGAVFRADPLNKPPAKLTPAEITARDQRNQMRDIQRALRQAAHREEEERKAREVAELPALAPNFGGSLALAAAAYGAPVAKKPGAKRK